MAGLWTREQVERSRFPLYSAFPVFSSGQGPQGWLLRCLTTTICLTLGTLGNVLMVPAQATTSHHTYPSSSITHHADTPITSTLSMSSTTWLAQLEPAEWRSQADVANPAAPEWKPPQQSAPSVVWLIVMPAIPLLGGAVLYCTRRFCGTEVEVESPVPYSLTEYRPPDSATDHAVSHGSEEGDTDPWGP